MKNMSPEQLEQCFDLYYSTKRNGTGLGLATVKRIIEMHDGEIGVMSEEGRGTRFVMWLPLLQEIRPTRPGADEQDEAGRAPGDPGDSDE